MSSIRYRGIDTTSDYIDYSKTKRAMFPTLKPTTKTISIRLPVSLIEHLKVLANKKDIPYQSLLKILLAEKVKEEISAI
jgi:predicted DNA binding CopG/RHH family protein